jgi:multisubunit Na+/H+ antiporter MnhB subunit
MLALIGVALVALAFLLFGFAMVSLRNPAPPRWAGLFLAAEIAGVAITVILGLGVAAMWAWDPTFRAPWSWLADFALALSIPACFAAVWYGFGVARRLKAFRGF